jgi:hypothetical protein
MLGVLLLVRWLCLSAAVDSSSEEVGLVLDEEEGDGLYFLLFLLFGLLGLRDSFLLLGPVILILLEDELDLLLLILRQILPRPY